MAVDGFARALAFAAATAEEVSELQQNVEATKEEINTTLANYYTKEEVIAAIEEAIGVVLEGEY